MNNTASLFISVPVASFRAPFAREYFESLPCPPPSTIFGMLLSLIGESDRLAYEGAEVALALVSRPEKSVVLRTLWRVKDQKQPLGAGNNKTPGFQELLTGVNLFAWVRTGKTERASPSLAERVSNALSDPVSINRFGGLSLGESSHLVDVVRPIRSDDPKSGWALVVDAQGNLSMPIWPDHVGSASTRWASYRLLKMELDGIPPEQAWTIMSRSA